MDLEVSSRHDGLACPDCRTALHPVGSMGTLAHRCGRCRGVWLDPGAFRLICDRDEREPGEEAALARATAPVVPRPVGDERVRYRACPVCRDVMNRRNFARVSGVVIDVCRPHGAWFDKGELASIRAFLRAGGPGRFQRHLELEGDLNASRAGRAAGGPTGAPADLYDVLFGGERARDMPSKVPRLLLVGIFTALGAWSLWHAFHPDYLNYRSLGPGPVIFGIGCFYFAWRALGQWLSRRGR